jgi:hypothetical protein
VAIKEIGSTSLLDDPLASIYHKVREVPYFFLLVNLSLSSLVLVVQLLHAVLKFMMIVDQQTPKNQPKDIVWANISAIFGINHRGQSNRSSLIDLI